MKKPFGLFSLVPFLCLTALAADAPFEASLPVVFLESKETMVLSNADRIH